MAGTIVANTLNTDTDLFSTNNAYSGIAKAWVSFNGTSGSPTIYSSFNVSSVTKSGTGTYIANFATAFSDTNWSCVIGGQKFDSTNDVNTSFSMGTLSLTNTTSTCYMCGGDAHGNLKDYTIMSGTWFHN